MISDPPVVGNPAILGPDEAAIPAATIGGWYARAGAGRSRPDSRRRRPGGGRLRRRLRRFNVADSAITVGAGQLFSGDLIRGIPTMYPLLFDLGFVSVYSYGVILAAAYFLALRYAIHRARRAGLDGQRIFDVGFVGIIGALVGAKLMLVVDFRRYASVPSDK